MIYFNEITKVFKTDFWAPKFKALDNLSFSINRGEMIGFLGANGAGKTTSLKILMDFIRPTTGKVIFDKEMGRRKKDIFSKIGFLPERPYFYPYLTGKEFIKYLGRLSRVPEKSLDQKIKEWSHRLCIDHAIDRKIKTYSKGMLQRLGFITTLIHEPWFIILDEPLGGLDPIGRKEIKDAIREVNKQGITVFFSSHIIPDIEEVSKRIIFINKGKLFFDGPIEDLTKKYIRSDYILGLKNISDLTILKEYEGDQIDQVGDLLLVSINENKKDQFMNALIQKGVRIESIHRGKQSLENMFYMIQQQEEPL